MVVSVSKKGGVGFGFYIDGNAGGSGGYLKDFTLDPSDRGHKHEMAHAINDTLFPTYHSWFDEGMAMYASGELTHPGYLTNYTELKSKGDKWFSERNTPNVNTGHLIGSLFFTALQVEYGMTPEQNRTALDLLKEVYLSGREPTKDDIKKSFETALNVKLDPLFDLLRPGVMLLYSTDPTKAGSEGYKINQKIRTEF